MIVILALYVVKHRFVPSSYLWKMERRSISHIVEGLVAALKEAKRKKRKRRKGIRRVPSGMLYYMDYAVSGYGDGDGGGEGEG